MLQAIPTFFSSFPVKVLFIFADHFENYSLSYQNCDVNNAPNCCSLSGPRDHLSLIPKKGVTELFDKLNDVKMKNPFVDCFHRVIKLGCNGGVFATEGQILDILQEAVKFS